VPALQIAEAASDLCDLVWLVDERIPDIALVSRMLQRLGTVVNVAGLSLDETVKALQPFEPDAIVAYRDTDIVPISRIAAKMGLDYHAPEVATRLVDKFLQREALRAAGVPSPLCWEIPAAPGRREIEDLAMKVHFPAVLKPRMGSGSQNIVALADAGDLIGQVTGLKQQAGGTVGMFVEQYLPSRSTSRNDRFADYVSVESLVADGVISHLAVTGRFPLAEPFRETGFFIPSDLPQAEQTSVLETATAALQALGVATGGCHTEIKLTPDGPRVIEVNGRLGGGIPEMLGLATGASLYELSILVALGESIDFAGLIPCARIGWRFLVQAPISANRVASIDGLGRLAELTGVEAVYVNRRPGDALDWREGSRDYICSVLGASAGYDELWEVKRVLDEEVSITYE